MKRIQRWLIVALIAVWSGIGFHAAAAQQPAGRPVLHANVMAPLDMQRTDPNLQDFEQHLKVARDMGVDAVSVDVWWGMVAASGEDPEGWSWNYYDQVFAAIDRAKLHIVPIMSFHRCGGNVGDDCNIALPGWVRERFPIGYVSEQDNINHEVVPLWYDAQVIPLYEKFMVTFADRYRDRAGIIDEILISAGPAGELRYPSYTACEDESGFPFRGTFQAYGSDARKAFQDWVTQKANTWCPGKSPIACVNQRWNRGAQPLSRVEELGLPDDLSAGADASTGFGRASLFMHQKDFKQPYGIDFLTWYNDALVDHGERMLKAAMAAFKESGEHRFAHVPLGIKVAAVHWTMGDPFWPRAAEMAAGYFVPQQTDTSSPEAVTSNDQAYRNIAKMVQKLSSPDQHLLTLHFTGVEKGDCAQSGGEASCEPSHSKARTLATAMGRLVKELQSDAGGQKNPIHLGAENALAVGVHSGAGWDNLKTAFSEGGYSGLTVLRLHDVTGDQGSTGRTRYEQFIKDLHQ